MPDNEGHKTSWNDRFKSQSNRPLQPEPFLIDHVSFLKPGSVLDIACGEGRNSVFLSQKGFNVSAIDFSEIALNRVVLPVPPLWLVIEIMVIECLPINHSIQCLQCKLSKTRLQRLSILSKGKTTRDFRHAVD